MADAPKPSATDDPLLAAYLERRANLVRFLAARAGSLAAAEDLAQELYLKLAGRERAQDIGNPTALLYRMALNLMLDRARGEARAAARDSAWRQTAHAQVAGIDVADEPAADDAAAAAQRLRQLVTAVRELPPQAGRAFRLHKLDGLSHAETARVMGLSVKAVEKHVSAALKALTAKLGPRLNS
ncbi:RNA polymerase sigma factor [Phenylobacterium sp.]|uniref:RNA polymerase sigma factor n=1 Tax=Phenylobacterium sp. TaxID=1871053 RepID=UPI00120F2B71|nr:RNA polymerase sigma factor [Phenylobacterium sp.]THD61560.1 MAG: RNA polymerase sigma factor [Phenylobacterium sp.]